MKNLTVFIVAIGLAFSLAGCKAETDQPTSDQKQASQQETLLQEATSQVGMPAIKNFRERKLLKDILELRDQKGLVTYTYLENLQPSVVKGKTVLGGKLTYFGQTIGYGLPYATQFTNPQKIEKEGYQYGFAILPQADPNGLFSPTSAEGTWVLMLDPSGKDTLPIYIEPRIVVSPFKLPFD